MLRPSCVAYVCSAYSPGLRARAIDGRLLGPGYVPTPVGYLRQREHGCERSAFSAKAFSPRVMWGWSAPACSPSAIAVSKGLPVHAPAPGRREGVLAHAASTARYDATTNRGSREEPGGRSRPLLGCYDVCGPEEPRMVSTASETERSAAVKWWRFSHTRSESSTQDAEWCWINDPRRDL